MPANNFHWGNNDLMVISYPSLENSEGDLRKCCPPFCDCEFADFITISTYKFHISDLFNCRCGEDDPNYHAIQWQWYDSNNDYDDLDIIGPSVTFHPIYSQGTAILRGNTSLATGMVHFWEIRILTVLTGTDVMFGIGTDKVNLNEFKFHFLSALGSNNQSWGYSYEGRIQHNGITKPYGQKFSQGCIIGMYLDRTHGYLEYFLNRRSLGIAFNNIPLDPNIKIYPMVCSTAAKSTIRLINSISQEESLQLRAFRLLAKQSKGLQELRQMPGLNMIMRNYWFLTPPLPYSRYSKANEHDIVDEAVLSVKTRLARKQKFKDDDIDINDLYSNAHKIVVHDHSDSEEDPPVLAEYFDEYFQGTT